ncbi:hypothetical protein FNV43_RR19663 [Rhamnella rubrinervis]|uniref:Pentatricopeptide repeat-containing protein n=1 Tax=Rhamnella rubrinervis TaxID=2594499 RepID=A0A8K0DTF1_9ROSA|nr:hypothetical protein FNV43_RR19663 [Rhamnella rubrinervis]
MQALGRSYSSITIWQALGSILKLKGPVELYRGIEAMGLNARPAHTVYFSVYKWFKKVFSNENPNNSAAHAVFGMFATMASNVVITLMDMVKDTTTQTLYATSIIKFMLHSGYLPFVKSWSSIVSHLAGSGNDGPSEALKLFNLVTRCVWQFSDLKLVSDSWPHMATYNSALNACANLGEMKRFLQLFVQMFEFGVEPDVLTYNVMIKLCARASRKDLLVFVLERILKKEIPLYTTTLHSLESFAYYYRDS